MLEIKKAVYTFSLEIDDECCFPGEKPIKRAHYVAISGLSSYSVEEDAIEKFEKGRIIFRTEKYVTDWDIRDIYKKEIRNPNNKTEEDLIKAVNKKIKELNTIKSPEYKEKQLLDKINELYSKAKGEMIKEEILYSGKFLKTIKETYLLPNNKIVEKEKIIKNNGKNSVIIIPATDDIYPNIKYIITFQQRINGKMIAEFPSGYIEEDESPIEAAKRELMEETSYTSDRIFIMDEAYTSPGIDNSKTYIVFAQACEKTNTTEKEQTELLSYGLFSEKELDYLVGNNIMGGTMNRLAYYNMKYNNEARCGRTKKLEL